MTARQFTDTFMPLREPLYRVAYYILESGQDAEDALQDLYVRLWNSRETLDGIINPRAYCMMMMKNECIDRIRRTRMSDVLAEQVGAMAEDCDLLRSLEAKDRLERVMEAMERLTDSERDVLRMRAIDDLSYDEMSERTGMSNLTLRVLLSRARRKIRNVK